MDLKKPLALLLALTLSGCAAEVTDPAEAPVSDPVQTQAQDFSSIRPQDDYYGYINAQTLSETLPEYGENSAGAFADVDAVVTFELSSIIENVANSPEAYGPGTNEQLIQSLYSQVMDYKDDGSIMKELTILIDKINSTQSIQELMDLWGTLSQEHSIQIPVPFMVYENYFSPREYCVIISQIPNLLGYPLEDIRVDENTCLDLRDYTRSLLVPFEKTDDPYASAEAKGTDLVYAALELSYETDYEIMYSADIVGNLTFVSDDELSSMFPGFTQDPFRTLMGAENPYGGCYVQDKTQLQELGALLTQDHLPQWQTLLSAELVESYLELIGSQSDSFASYATDIDTDREFIADMAVQRYLENELGELYAAEYYTDEAAQALETMCEDLRQSYRELISQADWLTPEARELLLKKLESMQFVLGGGTPHETDPADADLIGPTLYDTLRNLTRRNHLRSIEDLGQPRDILEPGMSPQTVNACYDPSNTVTITVAIMNAPFFDPEADPFTNLGGLGAVVGHEMGHAFDSNMMAWNYDGAYDPEWLSEADREVLEERELQVRKYFSAQTVFDVYHVDGELTAGENYADLGGVQAVTNLAKTDEELTAAFENYAKIWSSLTTDDDVLYLLKNDEHSPDLIRVNAVLSSNDKFCELYNVQPGDGMYVAPEERVSRW